MAFQKIEHLNIEKFMGIKQFGFTPQTDFIRLEGSNAAGKSSIEKAISVLFMSKEDAKLIKNPVMNGENMATVSAEMTGMTITKSWTSDGKSRTQVLSKDGAVFPSPVKMIEGLIGKLPHDPTRLMNQTDKEIMETLLSLIDTDVNFAELEAQKKETFADRTLINRLKNTAETKRNGYDRDYPDAPNEELSISELSKELTDALAKVGRHEDEKRQIESNNMIIKQKEDMIKKLNDEVCRLASVNDAFEMSIKNYEMPPVELIKDDIDNADKINKQVRYMNEKAALVAEYIKLAKQADEKTQELKDIENTKGYAIKNANMPVPGISFDEHGLTYNKVPLSQCSTAEQLKVCLSIAVRTHPKTKHGIKVMLIHHGNNLDKNNLEYVKDFCEEHGYQTWIEIVADEPTGTGIFIEDGEIKDED